MKRADAERRKAIMKELSDWDLHALELGELTPKESALNSGVDSAMRLFDSARRGDVVDARLLIVLALRATGLVEHLYVEAPLVIETAATGLPDFPFLLRGVAEDERDRKKLIEKLKLGQSSPFKRTGIVRDDLHRLITGFLFTYIEGMRVRFNAPFPADEAHKRIVKLPPLSLSSRKAWAKEMAEYFSADRILRGKDQTLLCNFYKAANPERGLRRRRTRARANLAKRTRNNFGNDPIEATKIALQEKRIEAMRVTEADIRNGLRESIEVRLKSILKR